MQQKISIIDLDSMLYHSHRENSLEESIQIFADKFQNCLQQTECTHYMGFVGYGKTFRNKICENYKSNRANNKKLKWLKALKEWAIEEYGLNICKDYESDDAVAYWMNKDLCIADDGKIEPREVFVDALDYCAIENLPQFEFESMEKVLCAVDKDLLQSIPGKHFNYTYKLEDKDNPNSVIKGWWVETKDDNLFFAKQLLMGDNSDGVFALNGIGIKRAEKILENWNNGNLESFLLDYYIDYYKDTSKAIFEYQKNYRLLHLLSTDEDFEREIGQLPELSEIREVILNSQIEKLDDNLTF